MLHGAIFLRIVCKSRLKEKTMTLRELKFQHQHNSGVVHTTLNPNGPGVVRIHLVPPKKNIFNLHPPYVIILNGQDVIPINTSWAILLTNFIESINTHNGIELTEEITKAITDQAINKTKKVYPKTSEELLRDDLYTIIQSLCDVAYGNEPSVKIGYMTLGEYAPYMKAPHRMDLVVSSLVKDGKWHCNQKCLHCYAAGQQQTLVRELSTEEWKEVINRCKKAGIPQLTFTGGEPTLRKDLVELINYSSWFVTRLNTNGVLLTKHLCEQLYKASLDSIQITLYSSDSIVHNTLVGADNFEKTVKGISNSLEAGLSVSVNTPICYINSEYVETLKFLHNMGVMYVTCSGIIIAGNACKKESSSTQLSEEELFSIIKEAKDFCDEHHMEISFTSPGWISSDKLESIGMTVPTCGACLSNMAVTPNGNVVMCQSSLDNVYVLGNMLISDWSDIWNSKYCRTIRNYSAKMLGNCPLKNKHGY